MLLLAWPGSVPMVGCPGGRGWRSMIDIFTRTMQNERAISQKWRAVLERRGKGIQEVRNNGPSEPKGQSQEVPGSECPGSLRARHSWQDNQMPVLRCDHEVEDESSGNGSGHRFEGEGGMRLGICVGLQNRCWC